MESTRCYLTEYLINKLDIKDDNILNNTKELRKIINKSNYNGRLKRYDEIGPKLVSLLKKSSNEMLDLITFSKIVEISNLMNDLEIDEAFRKFNQLVSSLTLDTGKKKVSQKSTYKVKEKLDFKRKK